MHDADNCMNAVVVRRKKSAFTLRNLAGKRLVFHIDCDPPIREEEALLHRRGASFLHMSLN